MTLLNRPAHNKATHNDRSFSFASSVWKSIPILYSKGLRCFLFMYIVMYRFDDCVQGGESRFVDAFHVAETFRRQHPEKFMVLTRVPATFQKIHYDRYSVLCWFSSIHVLNLNTGYRFFKSSSSFVLPLSMHLISLNMALGDFSILWCEHNELQSVPPLTPYWFGDELYGDWLFFH